MPKRLLDKLGEFCVDSAPISAMICIAITPEWAAHWHWRALLLVNALLVFWRAQRARRTRTLLHDVTAQLKRNNDKADLRRADSTQIHHRGPATTMLVTTTHRGVVDTTMCEENDALDDGSARRARGGTPDA